MASVRSPQAWCQAAPVQCFRAGFSRVELKVAGALPTTAPRIMCRFLGRFYYGDGHSFRVTLASLHAPKELLDQDLDLGDACVVMSHCGERATA